MKLIEKHRSYQGYQEVYQHASKVTNCDMKFALYKPDHFIEAPVLYFLSGITSVSYTHLTLPTNREV